LAKIAFHNVDLILIREESSLAILEDLGVKTPKIVTTDVAINFTSSIDNISRDHIKPTIGVAGGVYFNALKEKEIRRYVVAHAKALDYMIEKYDLNVVFLPHDVTGFKNDDYDICMNILYEMRYKQKAKTNVFKNVHDYKRFLVQLDILVSSKMHPAVLAASSNVPFMYVVYDHKQTGFAKQVGLLDYCIDITAISSENLRRGMEKLWNSRKDIQIILEKSIPELKRDMKKKIRKAILSLHRPIC
jgi:polysaccharide pyruvyl transferase WcaK-like protein